MRASYKVEACFFYFTGITILCIVGQRVADVRVFLVTVSPPDQYFGAVQKKAIPLKPDIANACLYINAIDTNMAYPATKAADR